MKNNIGMPLFSSIGHKTINHEIRHFHFNIGLTQSRANDFVFAVSLENTTVQYCNSSNCFIVWQLSFINITSILFIDDFWIRDTRLISVILLIVIEWETFAIKIPALNSHLFLVLVIWNSCTFHSFSYFNCFVTL